VSRGRRAVRLVEAVHHIDGVDRALLGIIGLVSLDHE
jgi:hypothetical protein